MHPQTIFTDQHYDVENLESSDEEFVWEEYDNNKICRSQRISTVADTFPCSSPLNIGPSDLTKVILEIIRDYYSSEDINDVRRRLLALESAAVRDEFVYRSLCYVLDDGSEQSSMELFCSLMTFLFDARIITTHQFLMGMERILDVRHSFAKGSLRTIALVYYHAANDRIISENDLFLMPENFLMDLPTEFFDDYPIFATVRETIRDQKVLIKDFVCELSEGLDDELLMEKIKKIDTRLHFDVVRRLLVASLEKNDRVRERVSSRLSLFYGDVISMSHMSLGFLRTVAAAKDLILDAPHAVTLLTHFLLRAIVDEIISPSLLQELLHLRIGGPVGRKIVRTAKRYLETANGCLAIRYSKVWLANDRTTPEHQEFKEGIKKLLRQYFNNETSLGDMETAVRNLEMSPLQVVELVRKSILFSFEKFHQNFTMLLDLFAMLAETRLVARQDIRDAISYIRLHVSDVSLDCPDVVSLLNQLIKILKHQNFI